MRKNILMVSAFVLAATAAGAQDSPTGPILITNVNVFDGLNENLIENANVVIDGKLISRITTEDVAAAGGQIIDGGGRTMIPGLIDVHWHVSYCCAAQSTVVTGDILEVAIRGANGAEDTLLRGFTSVRDVGGKPVRNQEDDRRG